MVCCTSLLGFPVGVHAADLSAGFHIEVVDAHRERTLDQLDRDHEFGVRVASDENAFHAVKRAPTNSHPLPQLQERMGSATDFAASTARTSLISLSWMDTAP